jgi:hypothetical protein
VSAYFAEARDGFARAGERCGVVEWCCTVGGAVVRLRFAGTAMIAPTTRALAHLEYRGAPTSALTVHVWDSASTRTLLAPPPWARAMSGRQLRAPCNGDGDARPSVFVRSSPLQALQHPGPDTLSMLDAARQEAIVWSPDAGRLPYYERAAPLRPILHWWGEQRGSQVVHAAAVGTPAGAVLLVGKNGSGKSTAALSCLLAGLTYLGDNDVLLASEPDPFACSLSSCAKLEVEHLQTRLPELATVPRDAARVPGGKVLLYLHERFGDRLADRLPVRAILLPRVSATGTPMLRPVSAAAALTALAPSSLLQLPGSRAGALRALAALARRVPSHVLELGPELSGVGPLVADLIERGR